MQFTSPPSLRGTRLATEIAAAGFRDVVVLAVSADRLEVTAQRDADRIDITETDRPAIQAVIDAHDAAPTEAEQRPGKVRAKLAGVLATLEDAATDKATWDALTQAQRSELNRRAALATAKLIRHTLAQFDSPE